MKRSSRIAILFPVALLLAPWSPALADANKDAEASYLELTLDHAIRLALENNRSLLNARLDRTIDRIALTVAEDRYQPTATIGPSAHAQRGGHATAEFGFETGVRIPTGGRLTLRWLKPIGDRDAASDSVTIGLSQPLLKGYGWTLIWRRSGLPDSPSTLARWLTARRSPASSSRRSDPGGAWCGRNGRWRLARLH